MKSASATPKVYRGSRKHVLDWVEQPTFVSDLLALADIASLSVSSKSRWMPRGYQKPAEARLETFGPAWLPNSSVWPTLRDWWLKQKVGANTPNWDIALGCEFDGDPGLILVEAKANTVELKEEGKQLKPNASAKSV